MTGNQGDTVTKGENFILETEIEFQARCLLHGTKNIRMQPAHHNLGHGRLVVGLGTAVCLGNGCHGSSIWITIDLYVVNSEKVPKAKWDVAMRAVLIEEMGKPNSEPEPDPEPEPEPTPQKEVNQTDQQPRQTRAFTRPSLGHGPRI